MPAKVRRTSPTDTGTVLRSVIDQAALGIDDQAGAVVVALGDARYRIRHIEGDEHQRWRDRRRVLVVDARQLRRCGRRRRRLCRRRQVAAWPVADMIVALARARGEPASIDAYRAQLAGVGIVDGHIAHGSARAVTQLAHRGGEIRQVLDLLRVQLGDDRAARHACGIEDIARGGDEHAAHRGGETRAPPGRTAYAPRHRRIPGTRPA